jgi:ribose transport system permease protein
MTTPTRGASLAILERYFLLLLFAAVVLVFSIKLPDSFATVLNFRNIVGNQAVLAILSLSAIIPLVGGQFDLSVGSVLGLTSIVVASLLSRFSAPLWVVVVVGPALGAFIGLLNGTLIARLGLNSLITTLATATILVGFISWYTEGVSILTGIPGALTDMGSGQWLGLPRPLYLLAAVALLVGYLLDHTPYGRYLQAVGSNPNAARLVGLDVRRITVLSFVISGAITGFAGVLQVARDGGANPQTGGSIALPVLAVAFLGVTSIHPGRFNVPGTLLAVFFLATTVSGLSLIGVDNWVESAFNGAALLAAVALSTIAGRRRAGA